MLQKSSNASFAGVRVVDGELPSAPDSAVLYVVRQLHQREVLRTRGAVAVYVPFGSATPVLAVDALRRAVPVPNGTAWLERRVLHTAAGAVRLSPIDVRLLACLADGAWHDDATLLGALPPGPRSLTRLHSAVARLRRKLGGGVERAYGRSWRLGPEGGPRGPLLDALADERTVSTEALAQALGCSESAVRVRVHRQRKRGMSIETVDGGYAWSAPDGVRQRLELALSHSPLVVLTGPVGVGKTHLATSVFQGAMVSVAGADLAWVRRRLRALVARPPGRWTLDGLIGCEPVQAELLALVEAGHRVLVTARQGLPSPTPAVQVRMEPWALESLQATFPGMDVRSWHGLPLGHLPVELREEDHVRRGGPDGQMQHLASLVPGEEGNLGAAEREALEALGWLVHGRLPGPVWEVLRAGWQGDDWAAHAERLVQRLRARHELGRPIPEEAPLAVEALAVLPELLRWGQSCHVLVSVLYDTRLLLDVASIDRALQEEMDPDHRASLLFARYMLVDDGLDDLRRAVAIATPALAADYEVQLAHALWNIDRAEAIERFRAVGHWLDEQPPEEELWVRTDWLVSQVLRDPFRVAPEQILDQLAVVERRRLSGELPKGRWMVVHCSYGLGLSALARDQVSLARGSLVRVVEMLGPRSVHHGAIDLVMALVRDAAWDEAEDLWPMVRDADLSPPWHAHRACVRGLWRLARGDLEEARRQASSIQVDHPSGWPLRAVLAAFDGGQAPAGLEETVALVAAVLDGQAPEAELERLSAGRHLSPSLLRRIVLQARTV